MRFIVRLTVRADYGSGRSSRVLLRSCVVDILKKLSVWSCNMISIIVYIMMYYQYHNILSVLCKSDTVLTLVLQSIYRVDSANSRTPYCVHDYRKIYLPSNYAWLELPIWYSAKLQQAHPKKRGCKRLVFIWSKMPFTKFYLILLCLISIRI